MGDLNILQTALECNTYHTLLLTSGVAYFSLVFVSSQTKFPSGVAAKPLPVTRSVDNDFLFVNNIACTGLSRGSFFLSFEIQKQSNVFLCLVNLLRPDSKYQRIQDLRSRLSYKLPIHYLLMKLVSVVSQLVSWTELLG